VNLLSIIITTLAGTMDVKNVQVKIKKTLKNVKKKRDKNKKTFVNVIKNVTSS